MLGLILLNVICFLGVVLYAGTSGNFSLIIQYGMINLGTVIAVVLVILGLAAQESCQVLSAAKQRKD